MLKPEALPLDLPWGVARIEGWENWLFCDAIGAEPSYDVVHPGMGFVVCARGSAVSLSDLLAMADCAPQEGPMLVRSQIEFIRPLAVDVAYDVGHRVVSLERKTGKTIALFDLLTHQLSLSRHGENVFVYTGQIVLPRRS